MTYRFIAAIFARSVAAISERRRRKMYNEADRPTPTIRGLSPPAGATSAVLNSSERRGQRARNVLRDGKAAARTGAFREVVSHRIKP